MITILHLLNSGARWIFLDILLLIKTQSLTIIITSEGKDTKLEAGKVRENTFGVAISID